jgi:hypothetical protein
VIFAGIDSYRGTISKLDRLEMPKNVDPARMRYLESKARNIAKRLDGMVNDGQPERYGFGLLLFTFNGPELTWISNAERADMIKLFEELLERWKANDMTDFPGGIDARN